MARRSSRSPATCLPAASCRTRSLGRWPWRIRALFLHANVGITFDLVAVAASHPGRRPSRFQSALCAVCALHAGRPVVIAAWVFVDGQLLFQKPDLRLADGCLKIDLPISPGARFLTLVATDADLNIGGDHVLFHCPRCLWRKRPSEKKSFPKKCWTKL